MCLGIIRIIFANWILYTAGFLLLGCENAINYHPQLPESATYKVFRQLTSSSRIKDRNEVFGTRMRLDMEESFRRTDSGWLWERRPVDEIKNRGWNKDLLMEELLRILPIKMAISGQSSFVFSGIDSAYFKLAAIPKDPSIKTRLLNSIDTTAFLHLLRDRWLLFRAVPPGKYLAGQKLAVDSLNLSLKTLSADSLKILRQLRRDERICMEYAVYFEKKDAIQLDMEQFVELNKLFLHDLQFDYESYFRSVPGQGRIIKQPLWDEVPFQCIWYFGVYTDTGLPCSESKRETAKIQLSDENIQEKLHVTLYRFGENVITD